MGEPPIDGGWGWLCVLGCHICTFFMIGGFKTLGILFVEFNAEFQGSKAATAVVVGLIGGSMSLFSPIGTALADYYTERWLVALGGFLVFLGSFLTSFATSMTMVTFVFGICTGLGYGCMFGPSMILVGKYFNKKRSLASGLAIAGGSTGQLIIPLIIRYLIDEYQWRGGLFIYSALILHIYIGAALFRPLSFYTKHRKPIVPENAYLESQEVTENGCPKIDQLKVQSTPNLSISVGDEGKFVSQYRDPLLVQRNLLDERRTRSRVSLYQNGGQDPICKPNGSYLQMLYSSTGSVIFSPIRLKDSKREKTVEIQNPDPPEEKPTFLQLLKGSFCCCLVNKDSKKDQVSLFDWSLFKRPIFLMLVTAICMGNVGYVNLFMIIPPHCEDIALGRRKAAILLSVAGVCDLFARVFGGWFADQGYIRKNYIMGFSLCLTSLATFILPRLYSFEWLIVYSIIIGLMGGFYIGLFLPLVIDYVGLKRTPKAFGLTLMVMGFGNMPTPVLLGYLREVYGTWLIPFAICGVYMAISSALLFSENCFKRLDEKLCPETKENPTIVTDLAQDDETSKMTV